MVYYDENGNVILWNGDSGEYKVFGKNLKEVRALWKQERFEILYDDGEE